ncbi:MAG: YheC/YheD family endospore coat-associated protein [Desulfitobacteriaceae bacterium]
MSKKSPVITINVIKDTSPKDTKITVPNSIFNKLGEDSLAIVKVGLQERRMICNSNNTVNKIEVPACLAEDLGLADGMLTNVIIKDNKFCLGPVIAVFVSNGSIRLANLQKPGFRLQELFAANNDANTILYYFSVNDVDFINQKINGTYYDQNSGKWEKRFYPFPDVLYDRGGGTTQKQRAVSTYIRKQFEQISNLRKINSRYYFDKFHVYKELMKYKEMEPYLPQTVLYRGILDLFNMLKRTSSLYIKDCYGNNGRGVVRVVQRNNGTYEFSYFRNKVINLQLQTFDELVKQITRFFANKKNLLQEAIDVIEIDHRNVDLRATVQKNGSGQLGVMAYPVRIGKEKCPITSTKSGSTVYRFEDFFQAYFNFTKDQVDELLQRINTMLYISFQCLEEIYGNFGELGIDFAIDKQGKIWFIECNAKPGKDALYKSYDQETIRKAFLNPLEYAKYLSGF